MPSTQTTVVIVIVQSGGGGHEKAKSPSCLHGRERSVRNFHICRTFKGKSLQPSTASKTDPVRRQDSGSWLTFAPTLDGTYHSVRVYLCSAHSSFYSNSSCCPSKKLPANLTPVASPDSVFSEPHLFLAEIWKFDWQLNESSRLGKFLQVAKVWPIAKF